MTLFLFFLVLIQVTSGLTEELTEEKAQNRISKVLPIFQVVKFANDVCTGGTRNGTCYTQEECNQRKGTNKGTCASGFGVCCIFEMTSCGGTSSDNNTYLVQSSSTSISSPCMYKVCPLNNICRIRYDFTKFVISLQVTGTSSTTGRLDGSAMGSCLTDSFHITSPGNFGSPTICGTNTGYHMILDADTMCQYATFSIGPSTSTSRSWEIQVTQYACGNEDKAGPDGCLQYFTGTKGVVANFGWPPSITATTGTTTHLKNQEYEACIRRESGYCYICYTTKITDTTTPIALITQTSFGLSISPAAATQAGTGTSCSADYITIPNGMSLTNAQATTLTAGATTSATRYCGRYFNFASASTAGATVCSRHYPFRLGVKFNDNEEISGTAANTNDKTLLPGGILGFQLIWFQGSC